jgi:hypothetical protein
MKVNEYLQNLDAKFRFDLMRWNVSIGPEKLPIFGRFLTLFPLKRPVRRKKNTSNMAATVGNVIDDVTCKSSIGRRSEGLRSNGTNLSLVPQSIHNTQKVMADIAVYYSGIFLANQKHLLVSK